MNAAVHHIATPAVQRVLDRLGRTEDLKFSPGNRRLAIAAFHANRIAVFDIAIRADAGAKQVELTNAIELESSTIKGPHGVSFLDEGTVVVANREGAVELFDLAANGAEEHAVRPARSIIGGRVSGRTHTPGSVAIHPLGDGAFEVLVCNNYANTVTRHLLDRRSGDANCRDELFLRRRLDVPDGICVSGDGAWIAVSNHNTHSVLLYDRTASPGPDAEPDGVLRNVLCPHGVRFTPDQEHILVADAAARYVNVYRRGGSSWRGTRDPVRLFPVLSEEVFRRGRHNPQEGGPKGIDISTELQVLAVTCECRALAFFDVDQLLRVTETPHNRTRRLLQWRLSNAVFKRFGYLPGAPGLAR